MEIGAGLLYLIGKLGWSPRPGQDLDAGIRLQRGAPVSNWPVVNAINNQFSAGSMGLGAVQPTLNPQIIARAGLKMEMPGPNSGQQPVTLDRFPWTNPPIEKTF